MTTILLMAGGTASGKSTITQAFAKQHQALVINHDRYYKDIPHPTGFNFDEPDALDNKLLAEHLRKLKNGDVAHIPIYDFPTHSRLSATEEITPQPLIIVEGILTLSVKEIRELGDLLVYVDTPDDIRLARRIQRDVVDRGRSIDGVIKQYLDTVRPMHIEHILPAKEYASVILDGTVAISQNVHTITKLISAL